MNKECQVKTWGRSMLRSHDKRKKSIEKGGMEKKKNEEQAKLADGK